MHLCTCSLRREAVLLGWKTEGPRPRPRVYCEDFAACPDGRGARPPPIPTAEASAAHRTGRTTLRTFAAPRPTGTPAPAPEADAAPSPAAADTRGLSEVPEAVPPPLPTRPGYELPSWARNLERPPTPTALRRRPGRPTRPGYFSYDEYLALRERLRRLATG